MFKRRACMCALLDALGQHSSEYLTVDGAGTILKRVFQALADPGRRLMLERLGRGPASVSELGRPLSMSLAAVVQHVQVLEASGLVRTQKLGRTRTCTLDPVVLRSAERWISERRTLVERRLDRLGEYLAETAGPLGTGTAAPPAPGHPA
jgi:DNA-binding transcriptional ArsR family regulator